VEIEMSAIPLTSTAATTNAASLVSSSGMLGSMSKGDLSSQFLNLLVAEMKNQDPTNPLSNDQMVTQLAQLSSVTGINNINDSIQALSGNFQSFQTLQAAGMIGHNVLVPGSSMQLSDGKAVFGVDLAGAADSVKVTIKDASGKVVHTMNLGAQSGGVLPLQWDGVTDTGDAASNGTYTFEIEASTAGQSVQATALAFGKLQSVSAGASGITVSVAGIGTVALSDIRQII
jgi:flagellar basal-body rod modification protein FlgD